ncbi:MAG TPA: hypothetical protein PLL01_05020 [Rhodoferax sp.]|jgi:hypothetical protein|nr:hypothetical protein [Rhodoferax sp.]HPW28735.1 hypothetical protein [Rhodoferax sp.]
MARGGSTTTAAEAAAIGLDAAPGDCARVGGPNMQARVTVAAKAVLFHRHAPREVGLIEVNAFIGIVPVN